MCPCLINSGPNVKEHMYLWFNSFYWCSKESNDSNKVSKLFSCSGIPVPTSGFRSHAPSSTSHGKIQCARSAWTFGLGVRKGMLLPVRVQMNNCYQNKESISNFAKVKTIHQVDSWHVQVNSWVRNVKWMFSFYPKKEVWRRLERRYDDTVLTEVNVSSFLHSNKCQHLGWFK